MEYAALVVTYNRKEKLLGALHSLLNQSKKPVKIFLIDNHSTDGTFDLLKEKGLLDNPLINYQKMDKNYGGSGGFYYGIKSAMGFDKEFDYLSISDDDAFFKSNYFELMDEAVQSYPRCKAFCGTVTYSNGEIQTDHRRKVVNDKWIKEEEFPSKCYNHNFLVDTFSFVGCLISVSVLKKIGLPNKDYFIYYDDTEYSLRVRELTPILNVSKAVVVHQIIPRNSSKTVSINWKTYYGCRNAVLMKKSHSNWPLLNLYFIWHQLKLDCQIIFSADFRGVRRKAFYVYNRGFKDGMSGVTGKQAPFLPGWK